MPNKLISGPQRRTHPLVWLAAIICAILAVAVIIIGTVVFIGYLVIHPRVPIISVINAHLDRFDYSEFGQLATQVTIDIRTENDNAKAHATFSDVSFYLSFEGLTIAKLTAPPFEVKKNTSIDFNYVVPSSSIPLNQQQIEAVAVSLNHNRVAFGLKGNAKTQWKVGVLGSVKFMCHLSCQLHFHPYNGSYISSRCSSRSK